MRCLTSIAALMFIVKLSYAQSISVPDAVNVQVAVNTRQEVPVVINLPVALPQQFQDEDDPMRAKTFTKSFAADHSDKVSINNQYGSIQIKTWDKKEVKVDIDIKAYGNNSNEAQNLLDQVSIEAAKQGDQIIFKTKLDKGGSGNWGRGNRNGRKWRREVKINYTVYMPSANALSLSLSYGNVSIPDFSGPLNLRLQYGDLVATNLNNANNYINVQYGKTSIQNLNKATIKQQYGSGLVIGTAGSLDLDAQYAAVNISTIKGNAIIKQQYGSGLAIGVIENLDLDVQYANVNVNTIKGNAKIEQQYSNLYIGTVNGLNLNAQYTTVTIGSLRGNGKIDMQYNRLSIGDVTTGCKALTINGGYLDSSINFSENYNADFEVNTSYTSFKHGQRVSATLTGNKSYTTKNYVGKIGNGGGANVKVIANYGSVTFK